MCTAVLRRAGGVKGIRLWWWGTGNQNRHEWEEKKGGSSEQARVGTEERGSLGGGVVLALTNVGLYEELREDAPHCM